MRKIIQIFSKLKTSQLVAIPILISFSLLVFLQVISKGKYSGKPIEDLLIPLILFIGGFMGLPMIIRKESPGVVPLKGNMAVLQGILIMIGAWTPLIIVIISKTR